MSLSRTYDGPMPKLLLGGLVALLAAGLLWPLAELALLVVAEGAGAAAFLTPYNLRAVGNTIVMGAVVALTATVLGFVVAYAITVTRACGRGALKVLFLAPLFAPSIMPAIGIIYLVGSNGLLFNLDLYGPMGVFLAGLVFALPHTVMQLRLNLATMDVKLLAAARSLGAGPWRRFATVTLVHARAGLANAFMIAFILTITDFGVPKMLAGDFPMLATEIYALAVGEQNFAAAGLLSLGLLIPALLALQVTRRFSQTQTKAVFHVREPEPSPMRDAVAGVLAWCVVGAEVLVIGVVIYGSFITFWSYETQLTLGNYAFRNSAYGISPWLHSLIVSFAVAALGTVLAWMGAYLTVRMPQLPGLLRAAYDKLASLPVCIPGTVLGLAWAMTFSGTPLFTGTLGSLFLVIANTVIHLWSVPHITAKAGLSAMNGKFETVGQTLGAGRLVTITRVIVPLSRAELCDIFSYLFASAVTTISAVVFLYTPSSIVAAVAAIDMIDSGFISEGAAMSCLIFVCALTVRAASLVASGTVFTNRCSR